MKKTTSGFTIIELLIVIVIIAILATISIVAYNGIQNRAHDSAVQNDLNSFAKKIRLYEAENGELPEGGSAVGDSTIFPGIVFKPSKTAYATNDDNFYYCSGMKSGVFTFVIAARSKSGTNFIYRPETGMSSPTGSIYGHCIDGFATGTHEYSYGYYQTTDSWWSWANG